MRGGEESEKALRAWLAPRALFTRGRPPEDWGYPLALEVAEHLQFIERDDGHFRLRVESVGSISDFRYAVRRRIMERAARAFESDDDPVDELSKALAWWLNLPARGWSSRTFEPMMEGLPFKPILQPTRWNVFERWAPFLGFAWRLDDSLVPDPTDAVSDVLDAVLATGETVAAPSFAEAIGEHLPVVDGGQAFAAYRVEVGMPWPTDVLQEPMSLALLRLEQRGTVDFPIRADAPGVTLRCGGTERRIAQVRRPDDRTREASA
jgi:hypothetical protein